MTVDRYFMVDKTIENPNQTGVIQFYDLCLTNIKTYVYRCDRVVTIPKYELINIVQ